VCTGDIEDAPAINAIHSFKTHVDSGKIHVTADPKFTKKDDNLVRQPNIASDLNREESSGVVIVGGGAGAIHAIESLREVRDQFQNSVLDGVDLRKLLEWVQGSDYGADKGALCKYR
jgi:hypothetical protein